MGNLLAWTIWASGASLIAFVALISQVPSTVAEAKSSLIGQAWTPLLKTPVSADDRAVSARKLNEFCKQYVSAIPTPSPRENDWIDSEINAGRFQSISESVEFSKRYAGRHAGDCVNYTAQIIQIQKTDTPTAAGEVVAQSRPRYPQRDPCCLG